jgi:diguanylate cyclase (GGDEF)-like protein
VRVRSKMLAIMGVPLVILGGATLAMINASRQTSEAIDSERRATAVALAFQQVETDLLDAESSTRGFVISGESGLLTPYALAVLRLPRDMAALTELAQDGPTLPEEVQTLRELIDQRLSLLQSLQLMAPINGFTNHAQLIAITSSGSSIMRRFIALMDREETEAASYLAARQGNLNTAHSTWSLVGMAGMPIGMAISLLVIALYTQRFARRIGRTETVTRLLDEGMPLGEPSTSKDELGSLERALVRTGTRVVELQGELRRMGTSDPLTRLLNRRGFIPSGEHQLEVAKRTHQPMALAFLDLDGLKHVNDVQGHAAGDSLITEAAYVMGQTFRASDLIGRMGGDEFCVLFATDSARAATHALSRLQEVVDTMNRQEGRPFLLSFSSGLAMFDPEQPSTLDELIAAADERMYEAKRAKNETRNARVPAAEIHR